MYVSPMLASCWVHNEDKNTITIVKNAQYDRSQLVTRFLCQQFRQQADLGRDLQDGDGLMVPSPRVLEAAWCDYPADTCKRLRCLPTEWPPVYELL
jgi:hypothetical protein